MNRTDNEKLVSCITYCFNLAMDPNLSSDDRNAAYIAGKRLRGSLLNLLSMSFEDDMQKLLAVNAQITEVNKALEQSIQDLNKAAAAVAKATSLVAQLDKLLKFATVLGL